MGKGGGSAPAAPDYKGAVEAQAQSQRVNQYTPFGSTVWSPVQGPAAAPAPETTGSIKAAAPQPNRLPVVEGWSLRDVYDGTATVVGRQGIFDVIPGDPLPGVGRVDAIRRQVESIGWVRLWRK